MDARLGRFEYEVNGEVFPTEDRRCKGRDIRIGADLNPAADHRLVEVKDRYVTSIGLEDPIDFEDGVRRVFRAAEGDRDYDFTVDDLGWEWCSPVITEADVRRYGRIPDDRELVIEGPTERVVARGGSIDLSLPGVERIYSRRVARPTRLKLVFIVGGEPHEVEAKPGDLLRDVLQGVLKATENVGRPLDDWRVTDEPGKAYELDRTLIDLGIVDGMVLVASLKTGEAG